MKATIWDTMGEILHRFDTVEEAEEAIQEYEYTELDRNYRSDMVNIVVHNF